jgi:hypothetical protein
MRILAGVPEDIRNGINALKQSSVHDVYECLDKDKLLGRIIKLKSSDDPSVIHFCWLEEPGEPIRQAYVLDEMTGRLKRGALPVIIQTVPYTDDSQVARVIDLNSKDSQKLEHKQFEYIKRRPDIRIKNQDKQYTLFRIFELSPPSLLSCVNELEKSSTITHKEYEGCFIVKIPLSLDNPAKGHEYYWIEKEVFASGTYGSVSDACRLDITKNPAGTITEITFNSKPFVAKTFKNIANDVDEYKKIKNEQDFLKKACIEEVKNPTKIGNDIVLVMGSLGQMTLQEFFQTEDFKKSSFEDRIEIFLQIALHLHQLHTTTKKGDAFIQGDIKAENILINLDVYRKGKLQGKKAVKISIVDMGFAANVSDENINDDPDTLQDSRTYSTICNLAPEQINGGRYFAALKSDIFSLSPVLLMLFGVENPLGDKNTLISTCTAQSKELAQLNINPDLGREKILWPEYRNNLQQLVKIPYSLRGLFTQLSSDGQIKELVFPSNANAINLPIILTQFLRRVGAVDVTIRPDSEELLSLTMALKNLCLLEKVKAVPQENTKRNGSPTGLSGEILQEKENHYLAQLILISLGLWLKPVRTIFVNSDEQLTFKEFFQKTHPDSLENIHHTNEIRMKEGIVSRYKAGELRQKTYDSLIAERVVNPRLAANMAHALAAVTPAKVEPVSTADDLSNWQKSLADTKIELERKKNILQFLLRNKKMSIASRQSHLRVILSNDHFRSYLTCTLQEACQYLELAKVGSDLRKSLLEWMFDPTHFQSESNRLGSVVRKILNETEERIAELKKSEKLSKQYNEYLLINNALKDSPAILLLFNNIEFRNSLSTKQIVRLVELAPDKDKTHITNQLINELSPESSKANKETNLFATLFAWISSFNKKPKNIITRNIATEELVRLAIACPENSYFFDKLLQQREYLRNTSLNNLVRLVAVSSGKEFIRRLRIVKEDILEKIFFSTINQDVELDWEDKNFKKVFFAISADLAKEEKVQSSSENEEEIKTSFSEKSQAPSNVLAFYLFLLDNPQSRIMKIDEKEIDITTLFLSEAHLKKSLEGSADKKMQVFEKLNKLWKIEIQKGEKKLTDIDKKLLTELSNSLPKTESNKVSAQYKLTFFDSSENSDLDRKSQDIDLHSNHSNDPPKLNRP